MAQLDVQPKKKANLWWLWLLLAIAAIAIIYYLLRGRDDKAAGVVASDDSTANVARMDTTSAPSAVGATQTDWGTVDFNSPASTDPDITDQDISVRGNDRYTIYGIGENILFAKGEDKLQEKATKKLQQVTASLNKRYKGAEIGIFGNTDSTGDAGKNTKLGALRANAVRDWLVKNGGLDSNRVNVRSFGETKPVASNATESGRQQNRNVQIVALNNR